MIPGGGIDRFIGTEGLSVDEGGVALIRTRNLNTSGILAFIRRHRQQGVAVERYSYEHDKHQPPLLRLRVSCRPLHTALKLEFFNKPISNLQISGQFIPQTWPIADQPGEGDFRSIVHTIGYRSRICQLRSRS